MVFIKRIKKRDHVYLAEVKSVREGTKIRHKFIRYVGKEVDGKAILSGSADRIEITKVSVYGPLIVLHDIASRLGLYEVFEEQTPHILSLVYAHCIEPGSLVSIQKWYERTDLKHLLGLEDVTYDKLLGALDYLDENNKSLQHQLYAAVKQELKLEPDRLFYDVTNVYFYGSCCAIAKKGYNKDKSTRNQVQIGLAVTRDEKIPIFHKVFEGNISDARTIRHLFDDFEFNQNAWLVWDRGVTSKENILDARKAKFHVMCGLSLNDKLKNIIETELKEHPFTGFRNRVPLKKTTLFAKQIRYSHGTVKGYLTLCYNEKEKVAVKEERYKRIQLASENIKKKKPIPAGMKKYFRYNKVDENAVEHAEEYDGISLIFSTKRMPVDELLRAYFEKDKVEKAFRSLKSTLEIRPIRHWLTNRVRSHIFICYIAYYLLSILEYQLRSLKMTAPKALDVLKTLYKVHLTDPKTKNVFTKTVALTKEQEGILKAVNKKLLKCSQ